jgi:hypothetical protein
MSEHHDESSQDESIADPQEKAERKHALVRALLRTGHEIEFSLQNSLTIAAVLVIPLVVACLVAGGFAVPLPPAVGFGLLVPLWFIVGKTSKYAKSKATLYLFGGSCSVLLVLVGFLLAHALKPTIQSQFVVAPNKPSAVTGPAITTGDNSPANTGSDNTFIYGSPTPPKPPEKKTKKQKDQP